MNQVITKPAYIVVSIAAALIVGWFGLLVIWECFHQPDGAETSPGMVTFGLFLLGLAFCSGRYAWLGIQARRPGAYTKLGQEFQKAKVEDNERLKVLAAQRAIQERFICDLRSKAGHEPVVARVLGRGLPGLHEGSAVLVTCQASSLHISTLRPQFDLPIEFASLKKVEVSGPGKTVTGATVMGGGVGWEGIAEGILIASVLSALSTRTRVETYLTIRFDETEVVVQAAKLTPLELRLILSPAILAAEAATARPKAQPNESLSGELQRLAKLLQDGLLTLDEFAQAKSALLRPPGST